jgi:hypothetical protein
MSTRTMKLADALRSQIDEALKPLRPEKVILFGNSVGEIVSKEVHLP